MIPLLLAVTLTLPPDAMAVRVAEDGWPEVVAAGKAQVPGAGESLWWWSERCAPQRVTADAPAIECRAVQTRRVPVIDRASGKPARAARVVWGTEAMLADIPDAMLPSAITDAAGDATLAMPSSDVRVRVSGPHLATWWQEAGATLSATEAAETTIDLLTADRVPARRAFFELELPAIAAAPHALRTWAVAGDGRITVPAVPRVPLIVVAWSEDASPAVMTTSQFPPRLELPRGVSIAGRIVDAKRRPLAAAAIDAVFKLDGLPRGLRRRIRSGPAGRFAARGLPIGAVQLMVKQTGRATLLRRIDLDADHDVGDLVLDAARDVLVQVMDKNGDPVSDATLRTTDGVRATSGRDGQVRLQAVPAGDGFTMTVTATGYLARDVEVPPDARTPLIVELSRGIRVTGSVVHAESGEPAGSGNLLITNNGGLRVVRFEKGTIDVSGLDAGTLALEVRAAGLAPLTLPERDLRADDTWHLGTLRLSAGQSVAGRVVSRDDGSALAGAAVRALRRREIGPAIAFVMRDWVEGVSGDDGKFALAGLSSEPHVVIVEASGFAPRILTAGASEEDLTIELDRARTLVVDCLPAHRCGDEARLLYGGAAYPWASTSALIRNGRARFAVAPPGTAMLRLVREGQVVHERAVQVGDAAESEIAIRLNATRIRGTVVSGGRPRRGGTVELHRVMGAGAGDVPIYLESRTPEGQSTGGRWMTDLARGESAMVDDAGRFTFEEVEPGEFEIAYRGDGSSTKARRVVIPEVPEFALAFDLPPGELQGRVAREDGSPAAFVPVRIVDAGGAESIADTDRLGRFTAPGLTPGRASVTASSRDTQATDGVDIDAHRPASIELVLTKQPRRETRIAVLDPMRQPVGNALVVVFGGSMARVLRTDAEGNASFRGEPGAAPTLAAAYDARYGWAWGTETITMSAQTGGIVVAGTRASSIELYPAAGAPAHSAFAMLGLPTVLSPSHELRFDGLPEGVYRLRAGGVDTAVAVKSGALSRVALP